MGRAHLEGINQIERIMGSARDAETGNRRIPQSPVTELTQPYNDACAISPSKSWRIPLAHLRRHLTSSSASSEIEAVLGRAASGIAQAKATTCAAPADRTPVHVLVISGTGKVQMDQLRALADNVEAEERRLLADRTQDAQSNGTRSRYAVVIASGLDFLLIVFMFRYFSRERGLRLEPEQTAANLAIARAEVERNAEEVRQLNVTLEERVRQRTAELEATNRELEAFSYSVSHDLRAPLRTIDGFSLALEEDYTEAVDATGRDYIKRVRTGVQRMGQLIDALLQLSRITRAEITREPVDLTALANSVAANLREENPGRDTRHHHRPRPAPSTPTPSSSASPSKTSSATPSSSPPR